MTEPKPQVLTNHRNSLTSPIAQEDLRRRLTEAYRGRENHAASFWIAAELDPASGDTLLLWTDDFTGQTGRLGSLQPEETTPIVRALFAQLRAWRRRCESSPQARVAAAGGAR